MEATRNVELQFECSGNLIVRDPKREDFVRRAHEFLRLSSNRGLTFAICHDNVYTLSSNPALMEKDVQFAFRVEAQLREQFVGVCKGMDRPAGQVLREFMRQFVGEHVQASLFENELPVRNQTTWRNDGKNQS
jgi:hypothetical protein